MEKRIRTQSELPSELIHRIQLLLSEKEAARTCILSKSWRYAWSTIPNLRFPMISGTKKQGTMYKLISDTLHRYHRNNLPIETLDLQYNIINQDLASLAAQHWIRPVASKSCLKELSLDIWVSIDSFTLPNNIFSGENLTSINVNNSMNNPLWICSSSSSMINCVSLRVLELQDVNLTEDVLDNLVSTCSLLEKINLDSCGGLKTVKVKNLVCLRELRICSIEEDDILEIDNLPGLVSFYYSSILGGWTKPLPSNMDTIRSVRQLHINGVIIDDVFFNMISSKFLFLEDLNVGIGDWGLKSLVITSVSLKKLTLRVFGSGLSDVQVYAPKLVSFIYTDDTIPTLLFPVIAPKQIELRLTLKTPIDLSFLLKMREVLNLSSTFDIHIVGIIYDSLVPLSTDHVDDLRSRVSFPVTNVQKLSLVAPSLDECLWEDTPFFDALFDPFFLICHPIHLVAAVVCTFKDSKWLFSKLIIRGLMEKKTTGLKDVQLKNPRNGRWEALTSSWEPVLDTLASPYSVHCKLNWFSHQ